MEPELQAEPCDGEEACPLSSFEEPTEPTTVFDEVPCEEAHACNLTNDDLVDEEEEDESSSCDEETGCELEFADPEEPATLKLSPDADA